MRVELDSRLETRDLRFALVLSLPEIPNARSSIAQMQAGGAHKIADFMNLCWQILKCLRMRHVQHAFRFLFCIDRGDKQSRYA